MVDNLAVSPRPRQNSMEYNSKIVVIVAIRTPAFHARGWGLVRFPYLPILEKCAKGICLCNPLWSTQPNDRETVIKG